MPGGAPAGGPNTAQPAQGGGATTRGATGATGTTGGTTRAGGAFPGGFGDGRSGDTVDKALLSYLEGRQGATTYLLAVGSSNSAAPYIIQTGKAVMSLGGFSGSNPILTTTQLKALIKNNTVRYFLVGGGGRDNSALTTWVQGACTAVPSSAWQTASAASAATANQQGDDFRPQALYDCRASTARLP